MKHGVNWSIFSILLSASLLSVAAVFPYVLTVQAGLIRQLPVPITTLLLIQVIQSGVLFSVAIFFGLKLAQSMRFRLPLLEAITQRLPYTRLLKKMTYLSAPLGILIAVIIYAIDYAFTFFGSTISTHQDIAPAWQKLLAALYGGITEEILMRLFLMSLFVWIMTKIGRRKTPAPGAVYISIVLASVIFGLGHLPITASLTTISTLIVVRAIVLNGIGGLVFGWLFWKKGLESAMIAHFTTDIVLLTILPLLIHY